MVKLWEKLN
jgi:hypothetical protein